MVVYFVILWKIITDKNYYRFRCLAQRREFWRVLGGAVPKIG